MMGLFRLFWIPDGMTARDGVFVHYPMDDLLAIVALESQRAKAIIVGEDLGTIDPTARKQFAAHRLLSYRLVWFEGGRPASYPSAALAAVSTHDLPTIAGLWTGQDELDEQTAGINSNSEGWKGMRKHLQKVNGAKTVRGGGRCHFENVRNAGNSALRQFSRPRSKMRLPCHTGRICPARSTRGRTGPSRCRADRKLSSNRRWRRKLRRL